MDEIMNRPGELLKLLKEDNEIYARDLLEKCNEIVGEGRETTKKNSLERLGELMGLDSAKVIKLMDTFCPASSPNNFDETYRRVRRALEERDWFFGPDIKL